MTTDRLRRLRNLLCVVLIPLLGLEWILPVDKKVVGVAVGTVAIGIALASVVLQRRIRNESYRGQRVI